MECNKGINDVGISDGGMSNGVMSNGRMDRASCRMARMQRWSTWHGGLDMCGHLD